jgi:hypothetical protein
MRGAVEVICQFLNIEQIRREDNIVLGLMLSASV